MPVMNRFRTKYPGVFYIISENGEKIYYIRYRKDAKLIEEKADKQSKDMTPARAAGIRIERINGHKPTNKEKRTARTTKEKRWTIDKLWTEYKTQKIIFKSKPQDENRYQNYIKPSFGDKEPQDIAPLDVDRIRMNMFKKGLKPQTVKLVLSLLRRICRFGYKKRLSKPLSFEIEFPKSDSLKTEDLTTEQMYALLKAIEVNNHPQAGNVMLLALYTGMRRGEIFRLKWEHIDFQKGFINLVDPKSGKDQLIPLNDASKNLFDSIERTSDFVFPGRKGKQRKDIHHQVNEIKEAAGLPKDFRALHGLRHVYASMLASSGEVDLYTLQKLLTHKDPKMTLRYAHLRDAALKRGADTAGRLINNILKSKKSETTNLKAIRKK